MTEPRIASREQWLAERRALLAEEKALTQAREQLAAKRRNLPWVRLDQDYRFEGANGAVSMADLFAGRSQLIVYHFMFGPDWQEGCKSCSFWSDHFDGMAPHLAARDAAFAAVSRAPYAALAPFRRRMGWRFPWYSSAGSSFNFDFAVSFTKDQIAAGERRYNFGTIAFGASEEAPGLSVFARDGTGAIFHTYSTFARGLDWLNGTYQHLDLLPKGRGEAGLPWPMAWVRHHDKY
jgi:predicted dithiol-disulfide oxidoreductase (DUF899 family)